MNSLSVVSYEQRRSAFSSSTREEIHKSDSSACGLHGYDSCLIDCPTTKERSDFQTTPECDKNAHKKKRAHSHALHPIAHSSQVAGRWRQLPSEGAVPFPDSRRPM